MGRPEQRPDDARKISIWEGADECSFDEVYARVMIATADGNRYGRVLYERTMIAMSVRYTIDYLRSWEERGTIRTKVRDTPVLQ